MESRDIPSDAIVTSSDWDSNHAGRRARLNILPDSDGIGAWCAKTNILGQWIQVDLGNITNVTGLITQGRIAYSQYVTVYKVDYSLNGLQWQFVSQNGYEKEFRGNSDGNTTVTRLFPVPVLAKYIRIYPIAWRRHISMRFEILGCSANRSTAKVEESQTNECKDRLGMESRDIQSEAIVTSSDWDSNHAGRRARLNIIPDSDGIGAWSAKSNNLGQWIQVDLGDIMTVSGLITQGRIAYSQWVTAYIVEYSLDGSQWKFVSQNDYEKEFKGNFDADTAVTRLFPVPVFAKYIRIHPIAWVRHISMRFEILGCSANRSTAEVEESATSNCTDGLGLESGYIPSSFIESSGESITGRGPEHARLNLRTSDSDDWCVSDTHQGLWIQVNLGHLHNVTGVIIQKPLKYLSQVTSFQVMHSHDKLVWETIRNAYGNPKVFPGTITQSTRFIRFPITITAKYVRILPTSWVNEICMRFEIVGCISGRRTLRGCREFLGMKSGEIPKGAIQASTELDNKGSDLARLNSTIGGSGVSAWCPVNQNRYQWIQVYLGKLHIVNGIMTQGQRLQWVTMYEVSYRVNGSGWIVVMGHDGLPREFMGNYDEDTVVTNVLPEPIKAQFIRIRPLSWHTYPCLRFEVLGCLDVDDCVAGVCQNSGRCIDGLGGYTCDCLFGFDGDNCDQETGVHT
ncbi:neuropilin-1-like [Anneissia japonica]|uniref:neuropilin-1-like n=1 Tax=Anneissia japonica TaxID=1529436 RepID=UPI001425B8D4|nr:neuropilin-1-like [Anneissia japonica]